MKEQFGASGEWVSAFLERDLSVQSLEEIETSSSTLKSDVTVWGIHLSKYLTSKYYASSLYLKHFEDSDVGKEFWSLSK